VARRRRGCPDLFPGRRGSHAQPERRARAAVILLLAFARFPFTHFSVTFGGSFPIPSFALPLKIHALAIHALTVHALMVHALVFKIHALVVRALAVHAFTLHTIVVLPLAVLARMVLAFAILLLAFHAIVILPCAVLLLPLGLFAFEPPILFFVCPRGQSRPKSEQDSGDYNPVSHDILLRRIVYRRARP
jgi:hypothetical protein